MRYSFRLLAATASLLAGLSGCGPAKTAAAAPAQDEPTAAQVATLRDNYGKWILSQPGVTLPADSAALDEALSKQNWAYIIKANQSANSQDEVERLLSWERYQLYRGAGYNITFMYVRDLWRMGQSFENSAAKGPQYLEQARGLKISALSYLLYTYAIIAVDGERCADRTAPQFHRDQIAQFTDEVRLFAGRLTDEERSAAVAAALKTEKAISRVRDPDPSLCRGGIDELGEALEAHPERATTTGPQPGYPGKNVMVPIDPNRPPAYSDRADWPARRQKVRDGLPEALGAIVGVSGKPS